MVGRKTAFRIVLVLASVLLGLLAAEVGLRLYPALKLAGAGSLEQQLERSRRASLGRGGRGHFTLKGLVQPSSHPEIVYELKPRLDGDFKGGVVKTNSWGFRGPEVELEKPPGTYRVVGLGDSLMFGWGVHQNETYLSLLQDALDAREGPRSQVLNLAVPGYNTAMEVATFAVKGLAFDPDLVLIHFVPNDLSLPFFMQDPKNFVTAKRGLYLQDLVRSALRGGEAAAPAERELLPWDRFQRYPEVLGEVEAAYHHMLGEPAYRESMARLGSLTRERSIPVVVLWVEETPLHGDLVREVAAGEGFYLLQLRESFLARLRADGRGAGQWAEIYHLSDRDPHLNRLGHSLIAEALTGFLLEHRLVAGSSPPG